MEPEVVALVGNGNNILYDTIFDYKKYYKQLKKSK
jgi:hypothetical protein